MKLDPRIRPAGVIAATWTVAVVVVAVQAAARESNNFEIFRAAFDNLVAGRDPYALSLRHSDLFKYSPTFALLFAPFAVVPFAAGLVLWTALNAFVLYFALGRVLDRNAATLARGIVFLEAVGAMQNVQSNCLVAGLILLAFAEAERDRAPSAVIATIVAAAIKVFPVGALSFAFLHGRVVRYAVLGAALGALCIALPLVAIGPAHLLADYQSWLAVERIDAIERGLSVMDQMHLWLGYDGPNWPIQVAGTLALLAPLVVRRDRRQHRRFRLFYLASFLIYCVIFNHQAESPTFVIAVAGVAVWATLAERSPMSWTLFALVVVGTMLAASSAVPEHLQADVFDRYRLKVVPCILVWVAIQVELWKPALRVDRM